MVEPADAVVAPPGPRSVEITTKRQAVSLVASRRSAHLLVASILAVGAGRVASAIGGAGLGIADAVVVVATIALIGPVEWIVHRFLLHAGSDSWTSRRLGTGRGHELHHREPTVVDWLMLRTVDVLAFAVVLGLFSLTWAGPIGIAFGGSATATALTAWLAALLALAHYEWVHLLVHSRVRLRTPYARTLARRHRLHHFRDERSWLGVTTSTGDRLLGTLPQRPRDVARSPTAHRPLPGRQNRES